MIALALLKEQYLDYQGALDTWSLQNTIEGYERTVQILKKMGLTDKILKYGGRVLQKEPDIGLKMFINEQSSGSGFTSMGAVSMEVDDVLEFFNEVFKVDESMGRQRTGPKQQDAHSRIKQKYLEHITDNPKVPEKYSTMLGEMLIDGCFSLSHVMVGMKGKGGLDEGKRRDLRNFLETKSNYNAAELLERVQKYSVLDDEEIILLMKDGKQDEALDKYITMGRF